ncbi:hypothetical protein ACXR6G_07405 [Ancylomarina sp. YFZ004]
MKLKLFSVAFLAVLSLFLFSCDKSSDSVSDSPNVKLTFKAITNPVVKAITSQSLTFTEAYMGIKEMEIERDSDDDSLEVEYEWEGPYKVNLLTGVSEPEMDLINIEPGIYNEFEADIDNVLDGNLSFVVKAKFTGVDNVEYNVVFETDEEFELEIESEIGIEISETVVNNLLLTIDLNVLFQDIDFSTAVVSEGNIILLNKDSNSELAKLIEDKIDDVTDFEEDENEDEDEEEEED